MKSAEFKTIRELLGYTTSQIAEKLDVSLRTIQRWESTDDPPTAASESLRLEFQSMVSRVTTQIDSKKGAKIIRVRGEEPQTPDQAHVRALYLASFLRQTPASIEWDGPIKKYKSQDCLVGGCYEEAATAGMCNAHYIQSQRGQEFKPVRKRRTKQQVQEFDAKVKELKDRGYSSIKVAEQLGVEEQRVWESTHRQRQLGKN